MTFEISVVTALEKTPYFIEKRCFCCNKDIVSAADGSLIAYDAWPTSDKISRILMHRDCAFAMAQRIICDAWPNRNVGDILMKNNK